MLQECDIGRKLNEACYKTHFAKSTGFVDISRLADEDVELISRRTSVPQNELMSICISFELCSVSPLKRHDKSKPKQAAEACRKILKTANVLSKANQESTSVKICDKLDELLVKENKKKLKHSDRLCQAISEKMQ